MRNGDVIKLADVSKLYTLSQDQPILLRRFFFSQSKKEFWALKDVSLTVKRGETVAVIGENGAGKSTILKIIAGITQPTTGVVGTRGKIASLIELGAGFHPDLTGRENIILSGMLLGLARREVIEKVDEIIDFAQLGRFIAEPVRNYSAGMVVRLGFAIATCTDPDILLVDEVLAVGDVRFKEKCFIWLERFKNLGKTVVFVSHDLDLVERFSDRVICLDQSRIQLSGSPKTVLYKYLTKYKKNQDIRSPDELIDGVKIKAVNLVNLSRQRAIKNDQVLQIEIVLKYSRPVKQSFVGYIVSDELGHKIIANNTYAEAVRLGAGEDEGEVLVTIRQPVPLRQGKYRLQVHVFPRPNLPVYFDVKDPAAEFVVTTNKVIYTAVYLQPKFKVKRLL